MHEWVLLMVMSIYDKPGIVRDIAPSTISGFTSKEACQAALNRVESELIVLAGQNRESAGVDGRSASQYPIMHGYCLSIDK